MHISDLFKSFDQIRFRKTMVAQAKGTKLVAHRAHSFKCPVCDSAMDVSGESDLSEFGRANLQLHAMECSCCGMMTERLYHDAKGYEATLLPGIHSRL